MDAQLKKGLAAIGPAKIRSSSEEGEGKMKQ